MRQGVMLVTMATICIVLAPGLRQRFCANLQNHTGVKSLFSVPSELNLFRQTSQLGCPADGQVDAGYVYAVTEGIWGDARQGTELLRQSIWDRRIPMRSLHLGLALERLGNLTGAIDVWREGGVAEYFASRGKAGNSIPLLRRAIEIGPARAEVYYWLGDLLASTGSQEEAMQAYRQGLAEDYPLSASGYVRLGDIQETGGASLDALASYQQAVRLGVDDPMAFLKAGRLMLRLNPDPEEGLAYLLKAQQRFPAYIWIYAAIGDAYRDVLKDSSGAETWYLTALARFPNNGVPYLKLAELRFLLGNQAEGIEWMEKALALEPRSHSLQYEAGLIYRQYGLTGQAVEALKKAVLLQPDNLRYQNLLRMAQDAQTSH